MISRRMFLASGLAVSLSALAGGGALASDAGLYEDVFDPQSSFVRVLAPDMSFAVIDGTRIGELEAGMSPYVNVMAGQVTITTSTGSTDLSVSPSTHYTVVLNVGAEPQVLTDDLKLNAAKADVSLYNLSAENGVNLYVPAAKANALKAVPAAGSKSIALKAPLTLDFEFKAGDATLAAVSGVALKRRGGVSVVLSGSDGNFEAVAVANTYKR